LTTFAALRTGGWAALSGINWSPGCAGGPGGCGGPGAGLEGSRPKGPNRGPPAVASPKRFRRVASLAGAGVLMNAPGRWRTGVGVAMRDAVRKSTAWASGPSLGSGPPQGRADWRRAQGAGRRSTVGDLWSVVDGSSFASAASPSCAEATEWHQAIATSMGPGLSSRVESRTWKSRSRSRSKERAAAGG
jgi:hypothetical protein